MIKIKSIKKKNLFVDFECYFIKFMVHFEYTCTYYYSVLQIIFFSTGKKLLQLCKKLYYYE